MKCATDKGAIRHVNADCVAAMRAMSPGSIDLVVTSPPYNAAKQYGTYHDDKSLEDYRAFAKSWVDCLPHVLTPTGQAWINVGYMKLGANETLPLTYLYHELASAAGLRLVQEITWHFEGGMAYKRRFAHRTERWLWLARDPDNLTFNLDSVRDASLNRTQDRRNHPMGKNPTDLWYFDRVVGGRGAGRDKTAHPCQYPLQMIERIVKACSNEGDAVLDPFGGSATTALAARNLGRGCTSIELDPEFHRIGIQRMASNSKPLLDA